ncbi:MAG: hypothetical protein HY303_02265 [Candidatus Wallbacteria bacterium]|nr:hypothetical protein [Candidatus Wallbacteria bacterium]
MPADRQALMTEVSKAADWLMKLSVDGGKSVTTAHYEELRKMTDTPAIRGVPRMAAMLEDLGVWIRAYSSSQSSGDLAMMMDKVLDCFYSSRAVKTYLQGKFNDLPALEEIFGTDRSDRKEEPLAGMEAVELGIESRRLGADRMLDTSTLVDLATGQFMTETLTRTATPTQPSTRKVSRQGKLLVEAGLLAPGFSPRRLTVKAAKEVPLERADIDRIVGYARPTVEAAHKEYRTFRSNFFAPEKMPVLLAPKGFYAEDEKVYLVDKAGNLLTIVEAAGSEHLRDRLLHALANALAVFGNLAPSDGQIVLVVGGLVGTDASGAPFRYAGS